MPGNSRHHCSCIKNVPAFLLSSVPRDMIAFCLLQKLSDCHTKSASLSVRSEFVLVNVLVQSVWGCCGHIGNNGLSRHYLRDWIIGKVSSWLECVNIRQKEYLWRDVTWSLLLVHLESVGALCNQSSFHTACYIRLEFCKLACLMCVATNDRAVCSLLYLWLVFNCSVLEWCKEFVLLM